MLEQERLEDRLQEICFTLDEDDVLKINKEDSSAGVHNVLANINNHCFGVKIFEMMNGAFGLEMFYITKKTSLIGDIIVLPLKDPDYFNLLLLFCISLSDNYDDVDAISAFNVFQTKLRSGLEKEGYFTATNFDLEKFREKNAVLLSSAPRGIIKIDLIDRVNYYREFFNNNFKNEIIQNEDYVYLMLNDDTGLIKIGYSKNPKYRERTLHSQEPRVFLIAFWKCSRAIERKLHDRFTSNRLRGEWFQLNFRDLRDIELLLQIYD